MTLRVSSISCRRGMRPVLNDVSFTLPAGHMMTVTGTNGSGKTTLLRAIAGLNDVTSGTVSSSPLHWIGPDLPFKPALSVRHNLRFWMALQGAVPEDSIILSALDRFGIAMLANQIFATLSSGQKKRVALSRLFLTPEKLWLLDEPETALDDSGRVLIKDVLRRHISNGGVALIATHDAALWDTPHTLALPAPAPAQDRPEIAASGSTDDRRDTLLWPAFAATFARDMNLLRARTSDCFQPLMLFTLMTLLFPIALGPDNTILAPIAGGLVMMAAFFASLLPLENIFADDAKDGTIETLMTTIAPMPIYAAGRILAHWLANGLMITLLTPVSMIMLGAKNIDIIPTFLSILPVTLLFTLIGAGLSALVLSTRRNSVLLALLAAPLYIPVLVFGSGALNMLAAGNDASTPILFLWAMVALFIPASPLIASGCLRLMRE